MNSSNQNLRDAVVIADDADFSVYIDERTQQVQYLLKDGFTAPQEALVLLAKAKLMGSTPATTFHLREDYKFQMKQKIAHAIALGLKGEVNSAETFLDEVKTFLADRAGEAARLWYVQAILTILIGLYLVFPALDYLWQDEMSRAESQTNAALETNANSDTDASLIQARIEDRKYCQKLYALAIIGGALGAGFSLLIRVGKLTIDPAAGRWAHYGEVIFRISIGALAALIIVIGLEAEAFASFLDVASDDGLIRRELYDRTFWIIGIFSILAGSSERLVPSLLQQLADNTGASTPQSNEGTSDITVIS